MITWIQNFLLKRGGPLILILLGIIIVAFVFTIGETPGIVTGERRVEERFFGVNLQNPQEVEQLMLRTEISYYLNTGEFPRNPQILQRDATLRLALLDLADKIALPNPNVEQLHGFVTTRPAFLDEDGSFSPTLYNEFLDLVDANPIIRSAMVERVLNEDFRRDRVLDLIIEPSLILPEEAVFSVKQSLTRFAVEKFTLARPATNALGPIDEAALASFFAERSNAYATAEERSFLLTRFPAEQFISRVAAPTEAALRSWFQNSSLRRELSDAARAAAGEDAEVPSVDDLLAAHHDAILAAWKDREARRIAGDVAHDFAFALWESRAKPSPEALTAMAAEFGGTVELTPLVSLREPGSFLPRDIVREGFNLDSEQFFTEEFVIAEGYGVIVLKDIVLSRIPELSTVREAVVADYIEQARDELLVEKGNALRSAVLEAHSAGSDLAAIAESAGASFQSFGSFSLQTPPSGLSRGLIERLLELPAGEVSPFITLGEEGHVLIMSERLVPEVNPESGQVRMMRENLGRFSSMVTGQNLLEELVQKQERLIEAQRMRR
jgi:peptidyl-prolyl cis-trans isomerase D